MPRPTAIESYTPTVKRVNPDILSKQRTKGGRWSQYLSTMTEPGLGFFIPDPNSTVAKSAAQWAYQRNKDAADFHLSVIRGEETIGNKKVPGVWIVRKD